MRKSLCFSVVLASVALAACDPSVYQDSRTQFIGYGDAVRQNNAVMIVDPQPATAANVDLDFDGRKDHIAIESYRQGKVIPPAELSTTSF